MRGVIGAILILAASVLVSAGLVADGINHSIAGYGLPGYALGGIVGIAGLMVFASRAIKRAWDAIPIEDLQQQLTRVPQPTNPAAEKL